MPEPPELALPIANRGVRIVETAALADLPPAEEVGTQLVQHMVATTRVYPNMGQEILAVPADRLRLRLGDYRKALANRTSWHTPAGILASLLAALVASDFKDRWLSSETWQAFFIIAAGLCVFWLCQTSLKAYRARNQDGDSEAIIEWLKSPPGGL